MAEYSNLIKYIKSFKNTEYNPATETGYWIASNLEGVDVWYIEISRVEHTIFEPVCRLYKLLIANTFEEVEPHRIIVKGDTIYLYVRRDTTSTQGRIEGKVAIL
jgi:hypothetical protein